MDTTSSSESKLATAKVVLSTAASVAATVMLARSVAQDFFPYELQEYLSTKVRNLFGRYSKEMTMIIDEMDGFVNNTLYESVETYLSARITPSTGRIRVTKPEKEDNYAIKMDGNEEIPDTFHGVQFKWVFVCRDVQRGNPSRRDYNATFTTETRSFEVTFNKKHKDFAIESYLPHIVLQAKNMAQEKKTLKIFTVDSDHMYGNLSDAWVPVNLDHPSTFDKLAMDFEVKDMILKDLERFVGRREYYRKVGKAWKRGYLLYGPPGTGKSSLIAAMANHLHYDIYDLELTDIRRNSELRRLLVATANRSILVVEDIDCTIDFHDRAAAAPSSDDSDSLNERVTLSGLLNFIDGLWSSCGDERIIVFTTNHKEKLDPALLRPGRMDVHVHMSYITPSGFRILASSYLGLEEHKLFGEIEDLVRSTQVTPAEVAEQLMRNEGSEIVLNELIDFMKAKKKEDEEAEAKKRLEDEEAEAKKKIEGEVKPKQEEHLEYGQVDCVEDNGVVLDNDEKK